MEVPKHCSSVDLCLWQVFANELRRNNQWTHGMIINTSHFLKRLKGKLDKRREWYWKCKSVGIRISSVKNTAPLSLNRALQKRFPKTLLAFFDRIFPWSMTNADIELSHFSGIIFPWRRSLVKGEVAVKRRCQVTQQLAVFLVLCFGPLFDFASIPLSHTAASVQLLVRWKITWKLFERSIVRDAANAIRGRKEQKVGFFSSSSVFFLLGGSEQRSVPKVPLISEEGGCHDKGCWGETNA